MNAIRELFSSNGFMPHGFCYQWKPALIWLHSISDTLIAVAYFSIPIGLIYLVRKKRSIPFDWMFVCFGIFIAACGATHLMEVVTLWLPVYWISGGMKVITALASLPAAILLTRVVPQVLNLPTQDELRAANEELGRQADVLRKQAALLDLSQDAILVQTIDGKNLLWNRGAERMYGWPKAEAIGQCNHVLLQTDFSQPRNQIMESLLTTGYWEGELQQTRRDGQTIIVSSPWALGRGPDGTPKNILKIDTDVTEQRRAENAMRASEERFRLMSDNIEEIFWLLDPKSLEAIYVSPAFEHICERSLASIYSNPVSYREIIHPEDAPRVLAQLALLGETNEFHEQFRIVCPKGTVKWVEIWGFTARDSSGNVTALVGAAQDITGRKRAEEERRRSDELLRVAFEKAVVGFSLTDRTGRFLKVNQAFCHLVGYSEEELCTRDFHSITYPEDLPANLQGMQDLLAGKVDTFVYQKRYITKSGEIVWAQNSVAALADRDNTVSGFVALSEDITARKRAEDALRKSEDRYRDLVEHSSDLICTHDAQGILLSVNEAPLRILGYSREEMLNKPLRDFVTPETRALCDAYLAQVQRDGFARGLLPVLTKSGEVRLWEYNNSLRKEGVSSPIVRGIAHDVTEQKRAEAALRRSEEKFSKAFRSSPVEMAITTLEEGQFLDVNETFERNLGYSRKEVLGHTATECGLWVEPGDRTGLEEELRRNGRVTNREIQARAKSGEIEFKLCSAEIIQIGGEKCLLVVSEDVTERKRAKEQLQRSEAILAEGQKLTHTGSWIWNPTSGELLWSRETFRIFELDPTAGKPTLQVFLNRIHPEDRPDIEQSLSHMVREECDFRFDCRIVMADGSIKYLHARGLPVFKPSGELIEFVGAVIDVGERKRREEELRRLSGQLLRSQDEERRKIARDLHDATGQDLVALSSMLGHLCATIPSSNRKLRKSISQCQATMDRCIREIRTLSYLLHPPMLDEAGLEDAIRHYVTGFAERTAIEIELDISPNFGRLPQKEELALFRVVQESLVNIHRHSGGFSAKIRLERSPEGVLLEVSDNGRGLPRNGKGRDNGPPFVGGVGIQSMRERMELVQGRLELTSNTSGTTVRATVPVNA